MARCLIVLLLILAPVPVRAGGVASGHNGTFQVYLLEFPELASAALERINEFRGRAEEYLAREDLPPAVREALSVLALQPPLSWSEALAEAAAEHARDMLERGYFSHVSPEGFGPMERVLSAGYPAAFVGESLAVMVFEQSVTPERALDILVKSLEEDALAMRSAEGAPLVFPFYRAAGAAMVAGILMFDGRPYYAYILDVFFALSDEGIPGVLIARAPLESLQEATLEIFPYGPAFELPIFPDGSFFFVFPSLSETYRLKLGGEQLYVVDPSQGIVLRF
ncbi:CAP domain-containing protein [Thermosulfurimonas sp. F29]|uniref:CAP domain-containing protein n=1 Tax=Thermosulfurimonas sp. F29 TaxID=2867247 RepID=UPI001C82BA3E|nr:CAP domain-containing protein [Thermosulfurimonas sp. F29]MBX6424255.1 hypothetical protein [Thermosulfurimonas sp. F29]